MRGWILILGLILILGCEKGIEVSEPVEKNSYGEVSKMDILFIIAQKDFRDEELEEPKKVLEEAGHRVVIASITTEPAIGMFGMEVKPDLAVKDAKVDDYAGIVIIGGAGSPTLGNYDEVLTLLKDAFNEGKLIGAICLGPTVLAKAGILNGKRATVWASLTARDGIEVLESNGAVYVKEDVVVDGNIVTAKGPEVATEFGKKLVEMLS